MILFDTHCDTSAELLSRNVSLYKNDCLHIDISRMQEQGSYVQFFAAFVDPVEYKYNEMRRTMQLIDVIYQQEELYKEHISVCKSYDEITKAINEKKVAAVLSIENGGALQGDISALRMFYKLGVRSIGLTWNNRNEIAEGVLFGDSGGGLTQFGREVVSEMNRLGMLIDVSHLTEKCFWDVIDLSKSPIIASHSSAKAICGHPRNLTDEQIMAVKANGGVIGLNFCPDFLSDTSKASLDDIIKHVEHIAALSGDNHIGFGSDFDGIDVTPADVKGVQDMDKILDKLLSLNYSQSFVEKFAGGNFMRVFKEVVK